MTDVMPKKLRAGDILERTTGEKCLIENIILSGEGKTVLLFRDSVGSFGATAGALHWLFKHGADPGSFLVFQRGAAPEMKRESKPVAPLRDYAAALKFDIQLKGA